MYQRQALGIQPQRTQRLRFSSLRSLRSLGSNEHLESNSALQPPVAPLLSVADRMSKADAQKTDQSKVVLYQTADRKVTVDVRFARETFWLTQKALAELFGVKTPAVNKHLKNIYASGELTREATISKMETVQTEGGREIARQLEFYNLDAAIAVGYLKGGEKP